MKMILKHVVKFFNSIIYAWMASQDIKARKIMAYYNVKFDENGNVKPWERL